MQSNKASFTLSEDDFVAANRLSFRRSLTVRGSIAWLSGSSLVLAGFIYSMDGTIDPKGFVFALFVLLGGFIALLFLLWLSIPISSRRTWNQRKIGGQVDLSWDAERIKIDSKYGDANFAWSDFYRWATDKKFILLYIDARMFYVVPKRALDPSAAANMVEILNSAGIQQR